jgi:diguanylate cyclase (GGDEF)-like protein
MAIFLVDDTKLIRDQLKDMLEADGYKSVVCCGSAQELLDSLGKIPSVEDRPELVLLDWVLPDMSGLDLCKVLKAKPEWRDLPVIMVTTKSSGQDLEAALDAGAADFVPKPVDKAILLARVRAVLRLKLEMDRRKDREKELLEVTRRLEEVIQSLQRISTMDALTGIPNRRLFDESLAREWRRCLRDAAPLSLIMIDLDYFKAYNDHYGHVSGDEALKSVASALSDSIKRPGDMVARYGGEEFAVILPSTPAEGATFVAELMRQEVLKLQIDHEKSQAAKTVSISVGVSAMIPKKELRPSFLVAAADVALYEAKRRGRNQIEVNSI